MRKSLLTLAAFALALTVNAQNVKILPFGGQLEKANAVSVPTPQVSKAPSKVALADNQRLVGYYTTDDVDNAVGLQTTDTIKVGAFLEPSDYQNYAGAKVVGVRFAMGPSSKATGVTIYGGTIDGEYINLTPVAEEDTTISSTSASNYRSFTWNTVMLSANQQFTLSTTDYDAYMVTYSVQANSAQVYPAATNSKVARDLYMYANISAAQGGSGLSWYSFGSDYGAPAIQLILESDNFPKNGVQPSDFGTSVVKTGGTKDVNVTFNNLGTSLKNFSYTITVNGQTSDEKSVDLGNDALNNGGTYTAPITLTAPSEAGTYDVTLNVTKVNGEANGASETTAKGTILAVDKELKRGVVVEEFTGTTCGYCPRGIVGMEKLQEAYPDNFVGIAIHQYTQSRSSDAMYNSNYANLGFTGAPSCVIDRNGSIIDPYYGSGNSILYDFAAELENLPVLGVEVNGKWNADSTAVDATATIDPLISGTYNIDFVLIANGIHNNSRGFLQVNYFNSAYGTTESSLPDDLKFLNNTGTISGNNVVYDPTFNDVLISSSYNGTTSQTTPLKLTAGQVETATYTLDMPTYATLKNAINNDNVNVIAIIYNENGVANAAKAKIGETTGINSISTDNTNENSQVVARYNAAGQRIAAAQPGLNILKLANGKTVKVIVK